MGQGLKRAEFSAQEYEAFGLRLKENLLALKQLLQDPSFGQGPGSFGAELEFYIIDAEGNPLSRNKEILARADDPLLTPELNRFNLEYNLEPLSLSRHPFLASEQNMLAALGRLQRHAQAEGGHLVPIGILPTLQFSDFGAKAMTDEPRYHALKKRLNEIRGGPFKVHIAGQDELLIETDDITFEGANTSFQVHYRVSPQAFAETYNALQLVTPLVLALAANSPTAFGQRLWQETRIPLFKKSIDCRQARNLDEGDWHQPARVNFGHGWLRHGAYELFAEAVRLYPPLLPLLGEEEAGEALRESRLPGLAELRLHLGTIWLWNRPIYDDSAGGHLRIEMRCLPAGPSVVDMTANAALALGLAEGLRPQIDELITALPFSYAIHNFYRAAQDGLAARLLWPNLSGSCLEETDVATLLHNLLPVAASGLRSMGISQAEADKYLGVIAQRLDANITGADWQLQCYERLQKKLNDNIALQTMLELYRRHSDENLPVAEWPLPDQE